MWGSEDWGTMLWGGAPAVPLLGPIGIGLLIGSFLLGGYLMQSRRRIGWFSTFGTLSLILIPVAAVATVTLPNVFSNGQVADADQVNANFDTLVTAVNYRTIARATGLGPADDLDSGAIASRVLAVTKDRADTALRIEYTDNLRAYSFGGLQGGCRWEVRVDGASCPGGSLIYDFWTNANTTQVYYQNSVVGFCEGLAVGPHSVQVYVDNMSLPGGPGNCYTGFSSSRWVLESEEVF